jgi:L-malate glycosyltransferase
MALAVAHLIGHVDFGGAERQVVNLLNAIAATKPILILIDAGRPNELLAQLDPAVKVIRVPCRISRLPLEARRLARLLRAHNISVLHSHMFWPNVYGALAASIADTPVFVTTEHGRNPWKRPWHRWLERKLISRIARRRICVSEDVLKIRVAEDGLSASQLAVVPNGTFVGELPVRNVNTPRRLLAVGRLVPAKDYQNLLAALHQLASRGIEVELQIAGEGPLRRELESECSRLGLASRVRFLGNRDDVASLLSQADIFVMSSRREGQPLALLEAMAAGMPIVSTAVGGVPATVRDGVEALLVPPADAGSLANALQKLVADPEAAARLGRNAYQRVRENFSIEVGAAAHLSLYQTLLAEAAA